MGHISTNLTDRGGKKCNFPLFVVKLFSGSWKQGALHVSLFFSLSQHRSASPAGLSSLLLITLWLLLWLLLLLLLLYGCCNKKKYKKSSTGKITSMMWQFQSKIKLSVNMFQLWRQCYFFLFNPLPKTFFYFINGFKNTMEKSRLIKCILMPVQTYPWESVQVVSQRLIVILYYIITVRDPK